MKDNQKQLDILDKALDYACISLFCACKFGKEDITLTLENCSKDEIKTILHNKRSFIKQAKKNIKEDK